MRVEAIAFCRPPALVAQIRRSFAIALGLGATAWAMGGPCSGAFTLGSMQRTFDGAEFDVVLLESSNLTLTAYSLGVWTPVEPPGETYGSVFRHSRIGNVSFGMCPLAGSANPHTPAQWKEYVNDTLLELGGTVTLRDPVDSSTNAKIVGLFGWTTREVTFVAARPDGQEAYAEYHVIASDAPVGVRFVLFGPQSAVEKARKDFRFFLSRLTRPE